MEILLPAIADAIADWMGGPVLIQGLARRKNVKGEMKVDQLSLTFYHDVHSH